VCGEAQVQTQGEYCCMECPEAKLDAFLATMRGRQLALVVDLDRYKEIAKLQLGPEEVNYAETLLLIILAEERDRYQQDMIESATKRGRDGSG
jgi:hypothetical protein